MKLRDLIVGKGGKTISARDVREQLKKVAKRSKYSAERTEVDGITFASKKEAKRYAELRDCQRAGLLRDLKLQPRFPLVVNNVKIGTYVGDFEYTDCEDGQRILEDVKGFKTPAYRLKKKLVLALYGVEITEI
mgnify:CR=1 FL=1